MQRDYFSDSRGFMLTNGKQYGLL